MADAISAKQSKDLNRLNIGTNPIRFADIFQGASASRLTSFSAAALFLSIHSREAFYGFIFNRLAQSTLNWLAREFIKSLILIIKHLPFFFIKKISKDR